MATVQTLTQSSTVEQQKESFPTESFMDKLDRLFSKIKYPDSFYKISSVPTPGKNIWNITFPEE